MFRLLTFILAIVLAIVLLRDCFQNQSRDSTSGEVGQLETENQRVSTPGPGRKHGAKVRIPRRKKSERPVRQDEELSESDEFGSDWSDPEPYMTLEPGVPGTQKTKLYTESGEIVAFYKFKVPRNAKTLTLTVDELPVVVNMYGVSGAPLEDADDASDVNPSDTYVVTVSRFDYWVPLEGGWFYLAVEVDPDDATLLVDAGAMTLDITVTAKVNQARVDGTLQLNNKISSTLSPEVGCFRTFELQVPEGADAIRLDLDRANADLNLVVRQYRQILDTQFAHVYSDDIEARESLILRREDFQEFDNSKFYIDVYSPNNESFTAFDLYATKGSRPPAELLGLPDFNLDTTAAENAMLSTVQIATQSGAASGTLVSEDGLILTNYHVVSEAVQYGEILKDDDEDDLVIAITTDPNVPPVEYFLAEVVEQSEKYDLALVRIKSGYYGQPLPEGYKFPFVQSRVATAADLGAEVRICGYPMSGSVENNPTYTVSRGVLSGFLDMRYLKTDADIASGNSGGAGFDEQWRLIGVPTMTIEDPGGAGPVMGVMMDLRTVPDSWGLNIQR